MEHIKKVFIWNIQYTIVQNFGVSFFKDTNTFIEQECIRLIKMKLSSTTAFNIDNN